MEKIEFGTDGVRQTAGTFPITLEGAQQIGVGVGLYLKSHYQNPRVSIGRDTRLSGDLLGTALSAGLLSVGVEVYDLGVITTAGVAYLTKKHNLEMGVVISASHNPWTENGIKLIGPDGLKLPDEVEETVEDFINREGPPVLDYTRLGKIYHSRAWVEEYIQYLAEPFVGQAFSRLHLAMDCSNGAASEIASRCFELLGAKVKLMHASPTGSNINMKCGSETAREGHGEMVEALKDNRLGLNFGVAFDGDADRAICIDEQGELVDGDHMLYILAMHLDRLEKLPGRVVVTTQMANSGLDRALEPSGIRVIRTKVGDKYVVREMLENGYGLGGEQSGHIIIYDEEHTTGDGIYTALFVASILLQQPQPSLHRLAAGVVKLPQVVASARVAERPALDMLKGYQEQMHATRAFFSGKAMLNVRYSGTEPLVRVMIEADPSFLLVDVAKQAVLLCRAIQAEAGSPRAWMEVKDATSGNPLDLTLLEAHDSKENGK